MSSSPAVKWPPKGEAQRTFRRFDTPPGFVVTEEIRAISAVSTGKTKKTAGVLFLRNILKLMQHDGLIYAFEMRSQMFSQLNEVL